MVFYRFSFFISIFISLSLICHHNRPPHVCRPPPPIGKPTPYSPKFMKPKPCCLTRRRLLEIATGSSHAIIFNLRFWCCRTSVCLVSNTVVFPPLRGKNLTNLSLDRRRRSLGWPPPNFDVFDIFLVNRTPIWETTIRKVFLLPIAPIWYPPLPSTLRSTVVHAGQQMATKLFFGYKIIFY